MTAPPSGSVSSLSKPPSIPSQRAGSRSAKVVVTSPPWARDEPPSPAEEAYSTASSQFLSPRPSTSKAGLAADALSTASTSHSYGLSEPGLSWWTFARRNKDAPPPLRLSSRANWPTMPTPRSAKRRMTDLKERSRTWLSQRPASSDGLDDEEAFGQGTHSTPANSPGGQAVWDMRMTLPQSASFTVANNRTPGWEVPWSPRIPPATLRRTNSQSFFPQDDGEAQAVDARVKPESDEFAGKSRWYIRKKRLRVFLLTNNYVPLLFRVINLTFTSAALAIAVRIRLVEKRYGVAGAVGSSPTLVIIFAPLTLVHVVAAIYLEYFGRPLGLWRTSMKLAHTLFETLFICAWSAALSLTFDNFFTAIIGCASPSSISWYNQIPRPIPNIPNLGRGEGGPADTICDDQIALICLVGVGLAMYCTNLVISLFRIFEKVKYHQPSTNW